VNAWWSTQPCRSTFEQQGILFDQDGTQRLYFVVETKSSLFTDDLRSKEDAKIKCGEAHFAALGGGENPARYMVATSFGDLLKTM
jgi:type III restriction enzyme